MGRPSVCLGLEDAPQPLTVVRVCYVSSRVPSGCLVFGVWCLRPLCGALVFLVVASWCLALWRLAVVWLPWDGACSYLFGLGSVLVTAWLRPPRCFGVGACEGVALLGG